MKWLILIFPAMIIWLWIIGPVANPYIGEIQKVTKFTGSYWTRYDIDTDKVKGIAVGHYQHIPYETERHTQLGYGELESGRAFLISDFTCKLQLPDSVLVNPY